MPQPPPDFSLLQLRTRHLFLLFGLELHLSTAICLISRVCRTSCGAHTRTSVDRANIAARSKHWAREPRRRATGIFEAVECNTQETLLWKSSVENVPLLREKCANKVLLVTDSYDAALEISDGYCQTTERVSIQEVGGFVEDKDMSKIDISNLSTKPVSKLDTYGLFQRAPARTTLTFWPPERPEIWL